MIRPMRFPDDDKSVRAIYAFCYPALGDLEESWFFANPTLVAVDHDENVMGFASFTVTTMPGFGKAMYGAHLCIHPDHRGKGLASQLHRARIDVARDLGCAMFIGVAHPDNAGMVRIFEESGAHACVPGPEGSMVYVGAVHVGS